MDDGSLINVIIDVDQKNGHAKVDFSGTSAQHPGNFNAPTAVAKAAVLYVFRCLVAKSMPLNAGFFRALEIIVPEGSMLSPQYPAAVVSGNVETAQYIVDTLLGALGIMAASQGTNNNFTFGDDEYQYYETLCGGAGATIANDGASAVHTHMTNSRLTDPEILEQRFPVMLEHFAIRPSSGGMGEHKGGDGIERHIRFLQPMLATIISGHRQVPTFGMAGGKAGKVGMNFVQRLVLDNQGMPVPKLEFLKGCADIQMNIGDVFCIHSPGGGGYGASANTQVAKKADTDKDQ
jgi:5-oxoprolinase (ATP-hydrolysing)